MRSDNFGTKVKITTAIGPVAIEPRSQKALREKSLSFVRTELRLVSLMSQSLESRDPCHANVATLRDYESNLATTLIQKLISHA